MSNRCSTPGGRGQDDYDYDDGDHDDGDHDDICVRTSMVIMLNYSEDKDKANDIGNDNDNHSDI